MLCLVVLLVLGCAISIAQRPILPPKDTHQRHLTKFIDMNLSFAGQKYDKSVMKTGTNRHLCCQAAAAGCGAQLELPRRSDHKTRPATRDRASGESLTRHPALTQNFDTADTGSGGLSPSYKTSALNSRRCVQFGRSLYIQYMAALCSVQVCKT